MWSHAIILWLAAVFSSLVSARWGLNSACPAEIKTTIPNHGSDYNSMISVHETLLRCPNITSLTLRVTLLGCSGWPDRWNFPFAYNGGETYPRLTTLKLDGYEFSSTEDIEQLPVNRMFHDQTRAAGLSSWLKKGYWRPWLQSKILSPTWAPLKSNLDLWLNAMDWSAIEELDIDHCRSSAMAAANLPPRLSSLRKLKSTNLRFIEALPNNTLTSLT